MPSAVPRSSRPFPGRFDRPIIHLLSLALTTSLLGFVPQPASAAPSDGRPAAPPKGEAVRGRGQPVKPRLPDRARAAALTKAPTIKEPTAGSALLSPQGKTTATVGGMKVAVTPSKRRASSLPDKVEVAVLDPALARRAGVRGPLVGVREVAAASTARRSAGGVGLTLSYAGFAGAYGGDYGSRLRLVRLPSCVTLTPERPECQVSSEVGSTNDAGRQTVRADVELAAVEGAVFALAAGDSSAQGSYATTKLAPSSQWSVTASSGGLNWSYPLRLPPVPGGVGPQVSLAYSSQTTDGKTATTNNQGSWVGEGFSYEPGYIERRYRSCRDDGHTSMVDLCWARQNAVLVLNGQSSELVKVSDTQWKLSNDDASKVELLTGATNDDNNGEHWKVTTGDGIEYYLGLNRLPGWVDGKEATQSTWTVPVFGDDVGEPCYNATLSSAHCQQAWRWNLDYVKDARGNVVSYFYGRETNHYARAGRTDVDGTPYHRGGYLKRIDYGQRAGAVYTSAAPARVQFTTNERCLPTSTVDCDPGDLNNSTASSWPDVPWDRNCAAGTHCSDQQKSPTFWTRKKLAKITTEIRAGTSWSPVDSWSLTHLFTDNGDASRSLWLSKITHTGHVNGTESLPSVELGGLDLPNRVDRPDDLIAPLIRFRLAVVYSDAGAQLDVTYAPVDCTASSLPTPGRSTRRCFPVKWHPNDSDKDPITDWFHKYVVAEVTETERTGGAPDMVTRYEYQGNAGWRYNQPDGITKSEYLTWGDWRGYRNVRVTRGNGQIMPVRTDHTFFQGLHGDKDPDGGTRTVTITDSTGMEHTDHEELLGQELEKIVYDGADPVTKTITSVWRQHTATQDETWGVRRATIVRPLTVRTLTALKPSGWREAQLTTSYHTSNGRVSQVDDLGDIGTAADDQCTRSWYTGADSTWLIGRVSRVETVAVRCADTPDRRTQVLKDERTYYDGQGLGTVPTKGDVTRTEKLGSHDGTTATYVLTSEQTHDAWGRELTSKDAGGNVTTTTYTHTDGLLTKTEVKNPLGHVQTTEYAPAWGLDSATVDANGYRTDITLDPLGRVAQVWLPDRSKQAGLTPSVKNTYNYRADAAVSVKTEKIQVDGSYAVQYELFDGHLRSRQVQTEGPEAGRLVSDTFYTATGKVAKTNSTYFAAGLPSGSLLVVDNGDVDAQTSLVYDGADRVTSEILLVGGDERWRTTTSYAGDRVDTDPPTGGTPKTTILDARGRVSELWQYKGTSPTGEYDRTRYQYHPSGQLSSVTDSVGNVWSYTYDQRGRKTETVDPDSGKTTYTYDDLDRVTTSKDARAVTLTHTYDAIGRKTATYVGSVATGTKILSWTYDTVYRGQLYSAARYVNGKAYGVVYPTRDAFYRAERTRYVIPDDAGAELKGVYEFTSSYNRDGTLRVQGHPAGGGLSAEAVTFNYDAIERPIGMTGASAYVTRTSYAQTGELQQADLDSGGKKAYLTWTYEEGTNRLTRFEVKRQDVSIDIDAKYKYDDAGNVLSIADTPAGGTRDVQCFDYDYLSRLSRAWTSNSTATDPCVGGPSVTGVGGPASYHHFYTYDPTGNRRSETRYAPDGTTLTSREYEYPDAGQAHPHGVRTVRQTGSNGEITNTFQYDDTGNTSVREVDGRQQTLDWDAEGHLEKVTEAGKTTGFVYDADGNRLVRKEPNATTVYLPGMELRLNHQTRVVDGTRYYAFGGRTIAVRGVTGLRFLASDHLGTAHLAIDAVTGTVTRRRTTPFGEVRGTPPTSWPTERGFVGGTQDGTTGLVHLGAREYDPVLGRFVSVDPIIDRTDPQQMNGYAYANNSPVTLSDASGLKPDDGTDFGQSKKGGDNSSLHNLVLAIMSVIAQLWMGTIKRMRGELSTDLGQGGTKRNTIPRAARDGKGGDGVADMIFWGEDVVYVWEVKPANAEGRKLGREQLDRYVRELQAELKKAGDPRKVMPGPVLPPVRGIPIGNGKVVNIWMEPRNNKAAGLIFYGTSPEPKTKDPGDPKPRPTTLPVPRPVTAPEPVRVPTTQPVPPGTGVVPHPHPAGPYGTCPGPGCIPEGSPSSSGGVHWDPDFEAVGGTVVAGVAIVGCILVCWLNPALA